LVEVKSAANSAILRSFVAIAHTPQAERERFRRLIQYGGRVDLTSAAVYKLFFKPTEKYDGDNVRERCRKTSEV